MKSLFIWGIAVFGIQAAAKGFQVGTCSFAELVKSPEGFVYEIEFEAYHAKTGDRAGVVFIHADGDNFSVSNEYNLKYIRYAGGQVRGIELIDENGDVALKATREKVYSRILGFEIPAGGFNATCQFN